MKVKKSSAYALHALMYMVRHSTQLPASTATIAKAEGIPAEYLSKIFQQLVKANFVKAVTGRKKGYTFARGPEEISLLELFETIEGGALFDDCFLKHCECSGTMENCSIFEIWHNATKETDARRGKKSWNDYYETEWNPACSTWNDYYGRSASWIINI